MDTILPSPLTLRVIACIVSGSIFGVLARKGVMALTTYEGAFLSGVVWANFGACFIMGFLVKSSNIWAELTTNGKYSTKGAIPLYTGLTTGFCGTFSSFSTVILEAFLKSANLEMGTHYQYPNAGYGVMDFLAVIFVHMGTAIIAFYIGKHICEALESRYISLPPKVYIILESVGIFTGISAYIIVIVLTGVKSNASWRAWTFSCIFAPFGAVLRYYLSKKNPLYKSFPVGTFAANTFGTLVLSVLNLILRGKTISGDGQLVSDVLSCQVLSGIDDGFCGGLTTVSTFISEIVSLRTIHAYKYAITSIIVSYCLVVLTLGSYNWSVGVTDAAC